jgi:hypothetical protein
MKKTTLIVLMLASNLYYGQINPVLQNTLGSNVEIYDMVFYNNDMYFSSLDAGKILKVNLLTQNATPIDVVTGLNYPTGVTIVGNELYFLQGANAALAPFTGKLSKINLSITNPTVTDLYSGLMFPIELKTIGTKAYISEIYFNLNDPNLDVNHVELSLVNFTNTPVKTVLYNQFEDITDIECKDNFLYVLEYSTNSSQSKIQKLNITADAPTTPTTYYTAVNNESFYKASISGNFLYSDTGSSPNNQISRINLTNVVPTNTIVVNPFSIGNDTPVTGEISIDTASNILYFFAEYLVNNNSVYLIYKADLNTLGVSSNVIESISLFPNPVQDIITFSEAIKGLDVYDLSGKKVKSFDKNSTFFEVNGLQKGTYVLKGKSEKNILFTKKILKN